VCVCVQGFVVVADLKVLPLGDNPPHGYLPLLHTMDDSKSIRWLMFCVRDGLSRGTVC